MRQSCQSLLLPLLHGRFIVPIKFWFIFKASPFFLFGQKNHISNFLCSISMCLTHFSLLILFPLLFSLCMIFHIVPACVLKVLVHEWRFLGVVVTWLIWVKLLMACWLLLGRWPYVSLMQFFVFSLWLYTPFAILKFILTFPLFSFYFWYLHFVNH